MYVLYGMYTTCCYRLLPYVLMKAVNRIWVLRASTYATQDRVCRFAIARRRLVQAHVARTQLLLLPAWTVSSIHPVLNSNERIFL